MHSKWKIYINIGDCTNFQLLRSRPKQLIMNNFNGYLHSVQLEIKSNPKKLFDFVAAKRKELTIPNSLSYDNTYANTGEEISNMFADYFASVYIKPESKNHSNERLSFLIIIWVRLNFPWMVF